MAYMELVENYENLVKSMVPMECMEPVISGVWDTTSAHSDEQCKINRLTFGVVLAHKPKVGQLIL